MAFDLDEAMGVSAPTKPKTSTRVQTKPSGFDLDVAIKNTSSVPISTPQEPIKRKPSLLNPLEDIVTGVQNTAPQLPQMGIDFAKSAVDNITAFKNPVEGAKATGVALGRGALTGLVDLAPSVAGLGVDVVNSIAGQPIINMPEERRRPLGYALEQWRDIQDTQNQLAKPVYPGQNPADLGIRPATGIGQLLSGNTEEGRKAQFAEMMGQFAAPLGVINAGIKGTKVATDAARIASKLNTAQKAKYASQIDKLAKRNVANNIKNAKPLTPAQEVWKNTKLGAGLGALEGEGLEEKAGNAFGGAALGAGLSGLHIGGRKAWNSTKGKEIRAAAKEGLDIAANQFPALSQGIAFLDSAFKTNLSKEGSLTDKRRMVLNETSKNTSLTKNISDRAKSVLDETKDLNKKEQRKIQNINQYGKKLYNQQTENGTKEFSSQEPVKTQETQQPKYEFIPEETTEPMQGSAPQQPINQPKPSISQREKNRIRKQAEQHRKETNNFKFPEEDPGERIHNEVIDYIKQADKEQAERLSKEQQEVEARQKRYEELKSQAPESNLSHVEEQGNINTPKEDLTHVKSNPRMAKKKNTSQANTQLKNDLKNNTFKPASMKEKNLESVIKLPSGEANGAGYLYEQTKGRENIFENVEKEKSTGRTSASSYSEETINNLKKKYTIAADGKTVIYKGGKKDGRRVPQKELEDLRKRLQKESNDINDINDEVSQEDRIKAEIEESAEDEVYYDKYRDNLSPGKESSGVERFGAEYKSENPEFIKWYGKYKTLPENKKSVALKEKLKSFKTKKDVEDFYNEFVRQEESDLEAKRQRKLGDEYSDTSDLQESERLSNAVEETKGEIEYEETPVEEVKKGVSPAQRKFVDNIWNEKVKGNTPRKLVYQGRLGRCRDSKSLQAEYDKIVNEIKSSNRSAKVKQIMIEDFNNIADKVVESKKNFNVEINKLENFDVEGDAINALEKAMDAKDLAKAKEIIENNELKYTFVNEKGKKLLKEYYTERADNVYKKAEDMGFKLVTEQGGNEKLVYDHTKAVEYCKKLLNSQYKDKTSKEYKIRLSMLKKPDYVRKMVTKEYDKLLRQNENIIKNDVRFAYDKNQKTFNRETLKYEETGDTWDRERSGADIGEQEAKQRWDALSEPTKLPETDNTRPALGKIGKELAKQDKVIDLKSVKEILKNIELPGSIKYIFNKHSKQGITVVSKDGMHTNSGYNYKTGELFIKDGLPEDIMVSKIAHELTHKTIHEAILQGGSLAKNLVKDIFGIDISPEEAVAKLKEEVNNNVKSNNNFQITLDSLYEKYGKDFVTETIKECEQLQEQGKTTRSLISDKRKIWKEIENNRPNNKIEQYCYDIESSTLDEYRQYRQQRLADGRTNDGGHRPNTQSEQDSRRIQGKRNEGKQEVLESDSKEGRPERLDDSDTFKFKWDEGTWDGTEFSATSPKVFDFFKKKKVENDKNNPINKIDNDKVGRVTDFFEELSQDREKDFIEYGTYPPEQLKNRLFQQSLTGEGIYTLKGSKAKGNLDLSREKKPKVGFTYEKTKQGLGNQGTVESQLSRMLTDQVRRSHARSQVELLKELFSKKEKGFEAINSKILWNAIYFGKSKAWFDNVSKGKRSIRNFFDKENAEEFEKLFDRVNGKEADIYVPKDVLDTVLSGANELPLDYLSSYGKFKYSLKDIIKEASSTHKNKAANLKKMTNSMGESMRHKMKGLVKLAGATLDLYNDRFKRKVLTSASFIANNRFGNQIMLMANSDSIKDYLDTWKDAKTLKEGSVPREILESTLSEALNNEANNKTKRYFSEENGKLETFAQIIDGQYVDLKTIESLPRKIWYGTLNTFVSFPNDMFKRISHAMGEVNERMERFERKQATSLALKKMNRDKVLKTARSMATIEELAKAANDNPVLRQTVVDKVNNILGDYNNFNKYEQNILRRVQPFYSWNRTIIRHILNLYKEDPVKATLILYETYRLRNQDDGLEDWQHGALKLPFKNKRTGTNIILNKTRVIPFSTPFEWFDGEGLGTLSPAFLKPIETIRGEKFFKGNPEITSKKWKKATQNKVKGYYNNKTGEFREGSLPLGVRLGYLGKDLTEVVYPALGSPLTKGNFDAIRHKIKTGKFLFPDKQYDADFGSYYHGDKAGIYTSNGKTHTRELAAKNRLDLLYQSLNKYLGLGIQPERAKEEVKARKKKFKRNYR